MPCSNRRIQTWARSSRWRCNDIARGAGRTEAWHGSPTRAFFCEAKPRVGNPWHGTAIMHFKHFVALFFGLCVGCANGTSPNGVELAPSTRPVYPAARTVEQTDQYHGVAVAD